MLSNFKNSILEHPFFYRLYQSTVRKKKNEYLFFEFIFSELSKIKNLRVLDICSGDSYVLNYIDKHITSYVGLDYNNKYLKNLGYTWPKHKFLNLDVTKKNTFSLLKDYNPNFIFINGAIHHLDDYVIASINTLVSNFKDCYFLSVDPINHNNKLINRLMINFDRGKFIRSKDSYKKIMNDYQNIIVDDFYIMSFMNIFHYKNFDLNNLYKIWSSK